MTDTRMPLAFLLHHANRAIKEFCWGQYTGDFYRVKDAILKKYGMAVGYDIQHIEGKKCRSCGGKGYHPKYSCHYPYNVYDYADCWHCCGGWFKHPQWICLERVVFGGYIFHRPLKRELCVKNPFTAEELGWQVSAMPVINGYIEHHPTWIGKYAIALIMVHTPDFKLICKRILKEWKWFWQMKCNRITRKFRRKPKTQVVYQVVETNEDLPF